MAPTTPPSNVNHGRVETFDRLTIWGRRWYFRAVAANGEIVSHSEAYNSAEARDGGIEATRRVFRYGYARAAR
jgi:hypothetical protein